MEQDYIPVIVSVSVIGGVILVALIALCIVRIVSTRRKSKNRYGDTAVLQEPQEPPSYVHYPAPEPYTPTHIPEDDPWQAGFLYPAREEYHPHDTQDHAMPHGLEGISRRPSLAIEQYRSPSVPNMPRGPSYAQDMPRGPSYAQDMARSPSYAQDMARRSYYAQGMPRRPSYAQDMARRSSYAQGMSRKPPNAHGVSRRGSFAQNMPERPSQIDFRRPSVIDHAEQRRGSFKPIQEFPNGHHDKLWYFYLQEDPEYFTDRALESNKQHPRVWRGKKVGNARASAPPSGPHSYSPDARARRMQSAPYMSRE